ncbi:hypothetical protein AB832_06915 [Flavobacteriaceae bacterium (ex Bugula neritina AB1)]|nr:hypothetical protein AB832_06915 [Flavobacteriaceae bacterium (ex Bugula neritina AB1)]
MTDFKKTVLWDFQKKVIKDLEELLPQAPFEAQRFVKEMLTVNKTVLRRLGYQEPKKKQEPPKHPFPSQKTEGEMKVTISEQQVDKNADKRTYKRVPTQIASDIELLDKKGHSVEDISDKLMVVEEVVIKVIKKLRGQGETKQVILAEGIKND